MALILMLTSALISVIHFHYFQQERLHLIQLNLDQNANLLMSSDLSYNRQEFREQGDDILESIIGDDKINVIVGIYNMEGKPLYMNDNAEIFGLPVQASPSDPEWQNIETKDYYLKILTRVDPHNQKIIRVGMILNQSLIRWKYLNQRIYWYVLILLLVVVCLAFLFTTLLFRPLEKLTRQIEQITADTNHLDRNTLQLPYTDGKKRDELARLAFAVARLVRKAGEAQSHLRRWSAMMAHELKTPLTVMKNQVEAANMGTLAASDGLRFVGQQVDQLDKILENFLGWINLDTNLGLDQVLHAVKIAQVAEAMLIDFRKEFGDEVTLHVEGTPTIFCDPIHFELALKNLLLNAHRYGSTPLSVIVKDNELQVVDSGSGLPPEVLARLGQPFNVTQKGRKDFKGHGLGLAWVNTICAMYGWELSYSNDYGCRFIIHFPPES